MKKTTFTLPRVAALAAILLAGAGLQAQAQTGDPGPGGPGPTTPPTTQVPIDGGASLLLAGSVAYGWRKLRQRRNAQSK